MEEKLSKTVSMADQSLTITNLKLFWTIIISTVALTATATYHWDNLNSQVAKLDDKVNTIAMQHADFHDTVEDLKGSIRYIEAYFDTRQFTPRVESPTAGQSAVLRWYEQYDKK